MIVVWFVLPVPWICLQFVIVVFHLLFVTVNILWLSLTLTSVGLQHVIVVFLDQTHLLFGGAFYYWLYKM